MKSPQNPTVNNPARLKIYIDKKLYTITGTWTTQPADVPGTKADLNALSLSFDYHVITAKVDLIYPDDIPSSCQLGSLNIPGQINHRFRVITSDHEIFWLNTIDVIETATANIHTENESYVTEELLRSVLRNTSSSMRAYLSAVLSEDDHKILPNSNRH